MGMSTITDAITNLSIDLTTCEKNPILCIFFALWFNADPSDELSRHYTYTAARLREGSSENFP